MLTITLEMAKQILASPADYTAYQIIEAAKVVTAEALKVR